MPTGPVSSAQRTAPVRGPGPLRTADRTCTRRAPRDLFPRAILPRSLPVTQLEVAIPQNRVACHNRNHSHSLETRVLVSGNFMGRRRKRVLLSPSMREAVAGSSSLRLPELFIRAHNHTSQRKHTESTYVCNMTTCSVWILSPSTPGPASAPMPLARNFTTLASVRRGRSQVQIPYS